MTTYSTADFRLTEADLERVVAVLRSGRLTEGENVERFELEWALRVGSRYCVAFSSGSTALLGGLLAGRELGILVGDSIVTNSSTFVGTVNAIRLAGFQPRFVDIVAGSFGSMSTEDIKVQLSDSRSSVAAVMPVHLFGIPEAMSEIVSIASTYGLPVVEDAAQAHGSRTDKGSVGSLGAFGIYSFYLSHTVPGVEMGAVVTDSADLASLLRSVKDQGRSPARVRTDNDWFTSHFVGLNFKTSEINAAIARIHVEKLDEIVRSRQRNAEMLSQMLAESSEILRLPKFGNDMCPFAFPMIVSIDAIDRDLLRATLRASGVETRPVFPCVPTQQPAYAYLSGEYAGIVPNSEFLAKRGFYVGCHEYLDESDIETIADLVSRALRAQMS